MTIIVTPTMTILALSTDMALPLKSKMATIITESQNHEGCLVISMAPSSSSFLHPRSSYAAVSGGLHHFSQFSLYFRYAKATEALQ